MKSVVQRHPTIELPASCQLMSSSSAQLSSAHCRMDTAARNAEAAERRPLATEETKSPARQAPPESWADRAHHGGPRRSKEPPSTPSRGGLPSETGRAPRPEALQPYHGPTFAARKTPIVLSYSRMPSPVDGVEHLRIASCRPLARAKTVAAPVGLPARSNKPGRV